MKKLIMAVAFVCAAVAAQAANITMWIVYGANILDHSGEKYDGNVSVYVGTENLCTVAVEDGGFSISKDTTHGAGNYDVTLTFNDGDYTYTETKACSVTGYWDEGDFYGDGRPSQFNGTGTWTGGPSDVPEPTSGLLMLIGVAGLALKRKRA